MVKKGDTVITCDNKVGLVVTSSNYDNMYTPTGAVISVRLANDATDIVSFEIGNSIDKLSLPRKFGIIFLDGDHRASTVYKEIPVALKCLEDGGVIILHDYFPNLEPLWKNQMPIAGPFLAIQRFIDEGVGFNIIPFGELPWSTKFGSNFTSLAILAKS